MSLLPAPSSAQGYSHTCPGGRCQGNAAEDGGLSLWKRLQKLVIESLLLLPPIPVHSLCARFVARATGQHQQTPLRGIRLGRRRLPLRQQFRQTNRHSLTLQAAVLHARSSLPSTPRRPLSSPAPTPERFFHGQGLN